MSKSLVETGAYPDIEKPRWDQSTYMGRAKHFFTVTNPLNIFASSSELEHAKFTVERYRSKIVDPSLTEAKLWQAKHLYDSAFHPETKEKVTLIGRMSAQVPMNMTITGCMMTFYKTTPAVVFWQWFNQSFNAVVNYSNRSGSSPISQQQLGLSYLAATGGAMATALGLNSLVKSAPPIVGRFVPFCAVAAANCVNIPFMRNKELNEGIDIFDENGRPLGKSKKAAKSAIAMVTFSRILMATPGMVLPPFLMNWLEKKPGFAKYRFLSAPIQVGLVGLCLVFATPLCCALFPQMASMPVSGLEDSLQQKINELYNPPQTVYYNKGL